MPSLVDKEVVIIGIENNRALNGKKGRVVSYDSERKRFYVRIQTSEEATSARGINNSFENIVSIKEENLMLQSSNQQREFNQRFSAVATIFPVILQILSSPCKEENWGLLAVFFTGILVLTGSEIYICLIYAAAILSIFELFKQLELKNMIARENNVPYRFRLYLKSLEFRLGVFFTRQFQMQVEGAYVLIVCSLLSVLAKSMFRSYSEKYYYDDDYYFDGGLTSGTPWSIGGLPILSLIFLGLIIYKLDIPRNGLGALRNLNFFEIMYLFNTLQQIFSGGNRRNQRRGFGYGSPYRRGYGGGRRYF